MPQKLILCLSPITISIVIAAKVTIVTIALKRSIIILFLRLAQADHVNLKV
jgi:hypothetical protein